MSQRAAVGGECHSPAGGQRRAGTGLPCSLTGGDLRAGFAGQGTSPPETAAPKGSRDVIIVAISCFREVEMREELTGPHITQQGSALQPRGQ